MSHRPFRFVHASDFHLETPVEGVAEVPEHLREPLLEAPYTAAGRVFDTVLAEEAELLVLSGDILHPPQTGPRGPLFLAEQFARLAQRQIPVYWASGGVDPPELWPTAIPLPENVHLAARGRVAELIHPRDGAPLARVLLHGRDGNRLVRAGDFNPDPAGLYTIAAVHGTVETAALGLQGIDYWALGGRHDRSTLFSTPRMAHYAGSPQGRRPDEAGLHGCTLVQVDENRQARTHLAPVDALRWLGERVVVDEATGRDELESLLRGRLQTLVETTPNLDLLVSWTVGGSGPLIAQLRRGALAGELLATLRSEHGFSSPAAWSVSMVVEPGAALPPEWYEQETIRGDFLRAIRQFEVNQSAPLELERYLCEAHLAGALASAAALVDPAVRQAVLRDAAWLGVDLLSGEEVQS
ncbi:MAG: metallophosphoesterase family protein [Thermoguttaceae bacterium]